MAAQSPRGIETLLAEYDNALSCIRCGLCLSVCPTYQVTLAEEESPRGRIAMARAVAEGVLDLTPDFVQHSQSCLLCEACTAICPAGVQMEPLGVAVREVIAARRPPSLPRRLALRIGMNGLLGSMGRFRAACRAARLYQRTGMRGLLRRSGLLRLLRLDGAEALLPEMPGRFIVPHGQVWRPPQGRAVERRVALFTGCIMSTAFAATTEATARVLARHGCEVVAVARQGCCGALHLHSGAVSEARALARRNVEAFSSEPFDAVVVNAAGCGSTLKGYGHLLESDGAAGFAGRVRDITEYLAELPADVAAGELRCAVTYQEPCHLAHAQRITQQPRRLLRAIPGLELREMREPALCCGSAGIYNLTNGEMSVRLLERKLDNAEATGASVIATANPGCLLQLEAGARERGSSVQVRHIVDLIDAAERLAER